MKHRHACPNPAFGRERGAALLVSLVLLLVMTLLAVTTTRTTTLQERMVRNQRNAALAFQAAETGLRLGEESTQSQLGVGKTKPVPRDPSNCSPCDVLTLNALDPMASATWSGDNVREGPKLAGTAKPIKYYIEEQQVVKESLATGGSTDQRVQIFYEVTARAVGGETSAESILKSTYVLRF